MNIENEYSTVDFSRFSKVKESLREQLHAARHQGSSDLGKIELGMDDLDYVAAAGTGTIPGFTKPLPGHEQ